MITQRVWSVVASTDYLTLSESHTRTHTGLDMNLKKKKNRILNQIWSAELHLVHHRSMSLSMCVDSKRAGITGRDRSSLCTAVLWKGEKQKDSFYYWYNNYNPLLSIHPPPPGSSDNITPIEGGWGGGAHRLDWKCIPCCENLAEDLGSCNRVHTSTQSLCSLCGASMLPKSWRSCQLHADLVL